ncbi:MAG: hypothetical protein AB1758_28800 [Candidatus Eremiobacterota bacterium]
MGKPRGSILVAVLLTALVLFTLLKVLIIVSHGSAFQTRAYQDRVAAGYALEAAVADAMARLEDRADWAEGFDSKPLLNGRGTYTVRFAPAGSVPGREESVNNLQGAVAVDGPRGPDTVPAGCVDMVVVARAGTITRRAEVIMTGTTSGIYSGGILASGRVLLRGGVDVQGISGLDTGQSVDANLHSNVAGAVDDVIHWEPILPTDTATIRGTVSASSSSPAAVQATGATVTGGVQLNQPPKPVPVVDVRGKVQANLGQPPPSIPAMGNVKLNGGSYAAPGDVTVDGDLKLDGTRLYVNGNLRVNGSLLGSGEVYVTGETRLQGDTSLTGQAGVALFSEGSIQLTGFDGTQYLETFVAGDPQARVYYDRARTSLQSLQSMFTTRPVDDLFDGGTYHDAMEDEMAVLTGYSGGSAPQGQADTLGKLADRLEATQPPGPSRDFVLSKLRGLRDAVGDSGATGGGGWGSWWPSGWTSYQAWLDGFSMFDAPGVLDDAAHSSPEQLAQVGAALCQFDVDRMGSSFFQGSLYTNGFLYASNDVTVVGAVYAQGTGGSGATLDGVALQPGDICLNRGVRLTLNQEVVQALSGGPPTQTGETRIKSWVEF